MEDQEPLVTPMNKREREILERLATGLSDQQIADELFLSLHTVKWYNRQIFNKLGVSNRTQAITKARALGLFSASDPLTPPGTVHSLTPSRQGQVQDRRAASQANDQPPPVQRRKLEHRVSFTTSFDATRIAYAIAGDGPPLVKVGNYMGHVEYDWDSPVWAHWLEELTHHHTLIYYDERGSGLSDWNAEDLSFETWVRDLEAVVAAAGLRRFPLFAMSQAGAVAVAYTARHPDKVSRLIVHGAYARGWLKRDLADEQMEEEQLMISLMRVGWGRDNPAFRQVFAMQLFPDAPPEHIHALEEQMRLSVSPKNAVRLESEMHRIDVRDSAQQITVPTLVLHSREDEAVPFEEGRLLASLIPKAQFVALESKNHLLMKEEPAWPKFAEAVRGFLDEDAE